MFPCFHPQEDDPNCYLQWNDSYVSSERVAELKPYQRINHFPGMGEICRQENSSDKASPPLLGTLAVVWVKAALCRLAELI